MVPHGERVMYMLMADIEKSIGELPEEDDPTDTLGGAASHG